MGVSGLASLLTKDEYLSKADCDIITRETGRASASFAKGIIALGIMNDNQLAEYTSSKTKLPLLDADYLSKAPAEALRTLEHPLLRHLEVIPVRITKTALTVAMVDPLDKETLSQLEFFTGLKIKPVVASIGDIKRALSKILGDFEPEITHLGALLGKYIAKPVMQNTSSHIQKSHIDVPHNHSPELASLNNIDSEAVMSFDSTDELSADEFDDISLNNDLDNLSLTDNDINQNELHQLEQTFTDMDSSSVSDDSSGFDDLDEMELESADKISSHSQNQNNLNNSVDDFDDLGLFDDTTGFDDSNDPKQEKKITTKSDFLSDNNNSSSDIDDLGLFDEPDALTVKSNAPEKQAESNVMDDLGLFDEPDAPTAKSAAPEKQTQSNAMDDLGLFDEPDALTAKSSAPEIQIQSSATDDLGLFDEPDAPTAKSSAPEIQTQSNAMDDLGLFDEPNAPTAKSAAPEKQTQSNAMDDLGLFDEPNAPTEKSVVPEKQAQSSATDDLGLFDEPDAPTAKSSVPEKQIQSSATDDLGLFDESDTATILNHSPSVNFDQQENNDLELLTEPKIEMSDPTITQISKPNLNEIGLFDETTINNGSSGEVEIESLKTTDSVDSVLPNQSDTDEIGLFADEFSKSNQTIPSHNIEEEGDMEEFDNEKIDTALSNSNEISDDDILQELKKPILTVENSFSSASAKFNMIQIKLSIHSVNQEIKKSLIDLFKSCQINSGAIFIESNNKTHLDLQWNNELEQLAHVDLKENQNLLDLKDSTFDSLPAELQSNPVFQFENQKMNYLKMQWKNKSLIFIFSKNLNQDNPIYSQIITLMKSYIQKS